MNVKHYVKQPNKSNICSHCCISMVTGRPLKEVIETIGHIKGTTFVEQKMALEKFNFKVGNRTKVDNRKSFTLPDFCLVRVNRANNSGGHLVVYDNGKIYDPAYGIFESKDAFFEKYNNYYNSHRKWKIHFYYEISEQNEYDNLLASGVEERTYKVNVRHIDTRHKIEKIMTESQLENVRKSDKFEVLGFIIL